MALSRDTLLERLFSSLTKRSDEHFWGQVTIEFQDGHPIMVRESKQRKLTNNGEVDGTTPERLREVLALGARPA